MRRVERQSIDRTFLVSRERAKLPSVERLISLPQLWEHECWYRWRYRTEHDEREATSTGQGQERGEEAIKTGENIDLRRPTTVAARATLPTRHLTKHACYSIHFLCLPLFYIYSRT